jgi:hypothetical protein
MRTNFVSGRPAPWNIDSIRARAIIGGMVRRLPRTAADGLRRLSAAKNAGIGNVAAIDRWLRASGYARLDKTVRVCFTDADDIEGSY